jgi:predicted DNA-binding antitoxin AbrB/MazE fold protein
MSQTLKAIYHNGAFIPQIPCNFPEGFEVEIQVQSSSVIPPKISDANARQIFLKSLVERMQQNPIPPNAPQFTREILHERR